MSDESNGTGWAPPGDATGDTTGDTTGDATGDATGDEAARAEGREPTVSFATEHTERIARQSRQDPPPPPPPPTATGGWAPPPPPGTTPSYGSGGWRPPPAPRRRTGLVVGILVGVLAVVGVIGVGAVLLLRAVDGGPVVDAPAPTPDAEAGVRDGRPAPEDVPTDDLEAQTSAVLETINASEERMLAFQEVVFSGIGDDGTVGDAAAEIGQEAQDAGNDLTAMRSDLRALAGGEAEGFDGLRDIRDTYAAHMDAWIEYLDAVAGSPALAAPDSPDAQAFWREIELSGDDFVQAVESGLPADLPNDLEELANFIVERGFGGFGTGPSGDVV